MKSLPLLFIFLFFCFSSCNKQSEPENTKHVDSIPPLAIKFRELPPLPDTTSAPLIQTSVIPEQNPDGFLWGLKDTLTKTLILPYTYQYIYPFVEGRAIINLNGKFGFIDTTGKIIVHPEFELVHNYHKRYASVGDYSRMAVIDYNGKFILNQMGDNNNVLPQLNRVTTGSALYDLKGNVIIPEGKYRHVQLLPEGMCIVRSRDFQGNRDLVGVTDLDGNIVLPLVLEQIQEFHNGRAFVKNGKHYGAIDEHANILFYGNYDRVWEYYNGFALVMKNQKTGFINKQGVVVVPIIYDWAEYGVFTEGLVPVALKQKIGFIDSTGVIVIPMKFNHAEHFIDGLAQIGDEKGLIGFINHKGIEIIPPIHSEARRIFDTYILAKLDEKTILYDYSGNKIDLPYDEIGMSNHPDFFFAREGNLYGLLDKKLNIVIPITYNEIQMIRQNLLAVKKGQTVNFLNKKGIIAFPFTCNAVDDQYEDGMIKVYIKNKSGLINLSGKLIVPAKYDDIQSFENGIAIVELNNKYGFININGKEVIPPIYDEITSNGYEITLTKKGKIINVDRNGDVIEMDGC